MSFWVLCPHVCIHVRVSEYRASFSAAADAVYVGHLFPRLLSLKSIVFFLFVVVGVGVVVVGHQTSSFPSPCRVAVAYACVCTHGRVYMCMRTLCVYTCARV